MILTKEVMKRFWEVLPDDEHGFYEDILEELRIITRSLTSTFNSPHAALC